MAIVLTKIKRKLREGDFRFSLHCLEELFSDSFTEEDAIAAINSAMEFDKLSDDESHVRYVFHGRARDGRALSVVIFLSQGTVVLKTAYEDID